MVFIVKIPGRSRANTPEPATATAIAPASTPSNQQPSASPLPDIAMDTPPRASPSMPISVQPTQDVAAALPAPPNHQVATQPSAAASVASTVPGAAQLDILLAPAVLNHRYVRGVDKSLIVERPERIRAVLLGIATAIGKSTSDDHPATPSLPSTYPAAAPGPAVSDDDDLVARLGSLSMQAKPENPQQQPPPRFRVLHSLASVPLNPPHPAVAYTHAHADELVAVFESAYDLAKQRRRDTHAAAQVKHEAREDTPTPAQPQLEQAASMAAPQQTSHAAYLELLCSRAPNHPPVSQAKHHHPSPSKHPPEDSEAYTSSDGEGDEAMHASEVPEHLPQGDLYLAGPSQPDSSDGGSAQAIQHAMGACCEAVDRVVAAATSSATTTPLPEIRYDQALPHTDPDAPPAPVAPAAAAKRAFVLSRPPGHHCSGSTPQGFCWVNNAVVASAHAYLQHGIDRIVVFDIDLHHGNGTQNLAWRINADANKRDDERAERIASLRAAALERARQALGTGYGRAHASRIAKVALSDQDEEDVRKQAGPRAMRMFYSSLHDIESFPCEDGDASMIKDASTCVEGAHGQWIWNVHLDHYRSEAEFKRLYADKYAVLFNKATRFLQATSARAQSTLVLISAGFDACAYEYPGMQRHGKHVPPSFYHTFARDAVRFADTHAHGKLVSVLEGGYSDRALCSAALAHVTGLATDGQDAEAEAEFWKLDNLVAVEKVAKKMAAHAAAAGVGGVGVNTTPKRRQAELVPWLARTSRAFAAFEQACGKPHVVPLTATGRTSTVASAVSSPSVAGRTLRDRAALKTRGDATPQSKKSPSKSPTKPRTAVSHSEAMPIKSEHFAVDMDASTPTKSHAAQDGNPVETTVTVDGITPTKSAHTEVEVSRAGAVDISSFLATSSMPQSPVLSAAPVTLVNAMSPTHILDANSTHSIIPLDYLDQDAPGSPDPTLTSVDYFPPQTHPKPNWT